MSAMTYPKGTKYSGYIPPFTGRREAQDLFCKYYRAKVDEIDSSAPSKEIHVIAYDGTDFVGKTSLLNKLSSNIATESSSPSFAAPAIGSTSEGYDVLQSLRSILNGYGFRFLTYDYAVKVRKQKGAIENTYIVERDKGDSEIKEAIEGILGSIPMIGSAVSFFKAAFVGAKAISALRDYLERDHDILIEISEMGPDELLKRMPSYFSRDLELNLEKVKKPLVIFLDKYERMKDEDWLIRSPADCKRNEPPGMIFQTPNVMWVLFTSCKLEWPECWDDLSLHECTLKPFDKKDTIDFLRKCNIDEENLHEYIFSLTGGVPAYLSLCAERYKDIMEKGRTPNELDFGKDIGKLVDEHFKGIESKDIDILTTLAVLGQWDKEVVKFVFKGIGISMDLKGLEFQKFIKSQYVHESNEKYSFDNFFRELFYTHNEYKNEMFGDKRNTIANLLMEYCKEKLDKLPPMSDDIEKIIDHSVNVFYNLTNEADIGRAVSELLTPVIKRTIADGRILKAINLGSETLSVISETHMNSESFKKINDLHQEVVTASGILQGVCNRNAAVTSLLRPVLNRMGGVGALIEKGISAATTTDPEKSIDEAKRLYENSILKNKEDCYTASLAKYVGMLYQGMGKIDEAIHYVSIAKKTHEMRSGGDSIITITDRVLLIDLLIQQRDVVMARKLIDEQYESIKTLKDEEAKFFFLVTRLQTLIAKEINEEDVPTEEWSEYIETLSEIPESDTMHIMVADTVALFIHEEPELLEILMKRAIRCFDLNPSLNAESACALRLILVDIYNGLEKYDDAISLLDMIKSDEEIVRKHSLEMQLTMGYLLAYFYKGDKDMSEKMAEFALNKFFITDVPWSMDVLRIAPIMLRAFSFTDNFDFADQVVSKTVDLLKISEIESEGFDVQLLIILCSQLRDAGHYRMCAEVMEILWISLSPTLFDNTPFTERLMSEMVEILDEDSDDDLFQIFVQFFVKSFKMIFYSEGDRDFGFAEEALDIILRTNDKLKIIDTLREIFNNYDDICGGCWEHNMEVISKSDYNELIELLITGGAVRFTDPGLFMSLGLLVQEECTEWSEQKMKYLQEQLSDDNASEEKICRSIIILTMLYEWFGTKDGLRKMESASTRIDQMNIKILMMDHVAKAYVTTGRADAERVITNIIELIKKEIDAKELVLLIETEIKRIENDSNKPESIQAWVQILELYRDALMNIG